MTEAVKHSLAWAGYKFASTVLDDIWPQVLFFSGVATMVTVVNEFTGVDMSMNSTMLTVLGTIVSLVVSFKTNNSYARWWEGRNVWTNITTNSRQLAMIIWLQIPNLPKEKEENLKGDDKTAHPPHEQYQEVISAPLPERKWHKKDEKAPHDTAHQPDSKDEENHEHFKDDGFSAEQAKEQGQAVKERQLLNSIIEKKTYIGLIEAFAVAMKHSLRGERGPFYSDLYSLIAFLPKYNPSAFPPVTRDNLMVLWQHGLPRQKAHETNDIYAVPLTQPATSNGNAFGVFDRLTPPALRATKDSEANTPGLTTTSTQFKAQAVRAASKYAGDEGSQIRAKGFSQDFHTGQSIDHHTSSPTRGAEGLTITTVELMPARHPPPVRIWDLFPPLRIFKVIWDWFKNKQRLEEEQERVRGGKRRRNIAGTGTSDIPQEILMYLSAYVTDTSQREALGTSFLSPIMTAINELQKAMSDLDKLATTPIPSAYAFHLRLTVWAYLFFLPFQLYSYIHWVTIPATAVASITYLGFLEIGGAIEMPFGYDDSDLDLDNFVLKISQQLAEVTAFPTLIPTKDIVLSHLNQPFLPSLSLSAPQLLGMDEPTTQPTTLGFTAAYPGDARDKDRDDHPPLPKSVRDVEMALTANWREFGAESKKFIGRRRDQLENRTGMEVAILAL